MPVRAQYRRLHRYGRNAPTMTLRGLEKAMYNQDNVPRPEYRIRTVVRYVVTRYCHGYTHVVGSPCGVNDSDIPISGGSSVICEVASEQGAYEIAQALAKAEGAIVQPD